jgi:hypothetical protein
MREEEDGLHIKDTRPCAVSSTHHLKGLASHVYRACDEIHTSTSLTNALSKEHRLDVTPTTLQRVLDELEDRKLVLHLNGRYLSLASRELGRIPDSLAEFPGGYTDVPAWQARFVN